MASRLRLIPELTYRDGRYYDFLVERGLQFPLSHIYNHEPIYGYEAHLDYNDDEFEKAFYWNACRGAALNEFYISREGMMNDKSGNLSNVINWQKNNFSYPKMQCSLAEIQLKTIFIAMQAGLKTEKVLLHCAILPMKPLALTLTLNKLMGLPRNIERC